MSYANHNFDGAVGQLGVTTDLEANRARQILSSLAVQSMPDLLNRDNSSNRAGMPGLSENENSSTKFDRAIGNAGASNYLVMTDAFTAAQRNDGRGEDFWGIRVDPHDINTGRRALGTNIMEHLGNWDWLIAHQSELRGGLSRAYSHMTPDAFRRFISELNERSNGRIYMETGNGFFGSLNPLNPPGSQVVRVYLSRSLTDNLIMDSRVQTSSPVHSRGSTHDSAH